jgi:hypothetical protein
MIKVTAGATTHLGVMTPSRSAGPYPLFCN